MALPSIPEYSTAIKTSALVHPVILKGGHPIKKDNRLMKYTGGFCVVFPFLTAKEKFAVRCWHAEISDMKQRTKLISDALKDCKLPYFVRFDYFEDGIMTQKGLQPIVVMDWIEALPLKKYISRHLQDSTCINQLAESFKAMVRDLHQHHLSHGDLQHGNILVRDNGDIVLVDYDSMYVPTLKGMLDEVKGLAGYQHKSRWHNKYVTEKADYFSELVIYLSLKALVIYPFLWSQLHIEDTETMLFTKDDIESPRDSVTLGILRKNDILAPLVNKLIEFIELPTLDDLQPLERAIVSNVDNISNKWGRGNGYIPQPGRTEDASEISAKWNGGNGYDRSKKIYDKSVNIVKNISNKFKLSK